MVEQRGRIDEPADGGGRASVGLHPVCQDREELELRQGQLHLIAIDLDQAAAPARWFVEQEGSRRPRAAFVHESAAWRGGGADKSYRWPRGTLAHVRGLLVVLGLSASSAVASPAQEIVVVATGEDAFRGALQDALAPAGMTVIAVPDLPPSLAELSIVARQIAEREHATSTVWLISGAGQTTLVTYDRDVDRVLVREVPYPTPLTSAQAAEIARMARTMLRALRVTAELDLPLPRVAEARVERTRAAEPAPPPPPPRFVRRPRTSVLAASAAANLRVGTAANDVGFDGRLAVVWRPDGIGLDLQLSVGNRGELASATFTGRISDHSLAVLMHVPVLTGPNVHVVGLVGAAGHALAVTGVLDSTEVSVLRFDPAIRLGVVASYEIGQRLDVGIAMSADGLLRRQKYQVESTELAVVPRVQLATGFIVTFRLL